MTTEPLTGKEYWDNTKELLGSYQVIFGSQGSNILRYDPKKMGSLLSRYKFAAKMACKSGTVLELGCGEGLGAAILGESCIYTGVDSNEDLIQSAQNNFQKFTFISENFFGKKYGSFDAVVAIESLSDPRFYSTVLENLSLNGVAVVCGTEKVSVEMKKFFHQVFTFGISDEIVHTGPSSDVICVGCHVRK